MIFLSTDPLVEGLVASLSRPGGNLTGFTLPWEGLNSKRAELLRDVFPRIRRAAFLALRGSSQVAPFKAAAAILKLDVLSLEVRGEADLEGHRR